MSSRVLVTGEITRALVRRRRNSDSATFGVFRVRDSDRLADRIWICYANDLELIEAIELLRGGEPVALTGAFNFRIGGTADEPEIEHRLTVTAIVDTRPRKAKPKKIIRREMRELDDADAAPIETGEAALDDPLPF
jgi:hypothetical protein